MICRYKATEHPTLTLPVEESGDFKLFTKLSNFTLQLYILLLESDPYGEASPVQIPILSRFRTDGLQ